LDLLPAVLFAFREFAAQLPADPVLGASTLAPTALETLPRSPNVIPDRARVIVDWRVLPGWTADDVVSRLLEFLRPRVPLAEGYGLAVRFGVEHQTSWAGPAQDRQLFTPGYLLAAEHPVAAAAAAAVQQATGRRPAIRPWRFATDGGHTCGQHGIPTVGYAPGEERFAHTNRERLELASARQVYHAYPAVIRAVQQASAGARR
ncbi:MAG: peptidase dimerization domain-containing protein, partial [Gemmatimonadetes bacterium]|nr:peptidase dimerization domain-containing protein [Gemmatimonadota bacterium]